LSREVAFLKSREYIKQYRAFLRLLREARRDAGLSQVDVARRFLKPQSFISKCESGERRVDFVELQYLAQIYKKPLSYFEKSGKS
jgi:transcriptional regulator with XRE-family HTH domain